MSDLVADMQAKVAELVAQAKEPLVRRIAALEAENKELRLDLADVIKKREKAEAALAERGRMLNAVLLTLFNAKAIDPSSPGARQILADLRARAEEGK